MALKQLSKENKEMFQREIMEMEVTVLQKRHEIEKLMSNREAINKSLNHGIHQEKNKILAAEANIRDYEFDIKNSVTFKALGIKIDQAEREITRLEGNVSVRKNQIE